MLLESIGDSSFERSGTVGAAPACARLLRSGSDSRGAELRTNRGKARPRRVKPVAGSGKPRQLALRRGMETPSVTD